MNNAVSHACIILDNTQHQLDINLEERWTQVKLLWASNQFSSRESEALRLDRGKSEFHQDCSQEEVSWREVACHGQVH